MAPWLPYAVRTESVSTTGGLLELLDIIDGIHCTTGDAHTMPLLVDVDIFYRIMKLMLSETWAAYPVRTALARRPLLFGVWHGYNHCVTRWFRHFLPFWVAIQSPAFLDPPTKTKCPRHPVLSTMETLVTQLFIVHDDAESVLNTAIADFKADLRSGTGDTADLSVVCTKAAAMPPPPGDAVCPCTFPHGNVGSGLPLEVACRLHGEPCSQAPPSAGDILPCFEAEARSPAVPGEYPAGTATVAIPHGRLSWNGVVRGEAGGNDKHPGG